MDSQIKKGSLEMCILMILYQKDCYGYEISQTIGELLDVKEGTIYLILQRLAKTVLLSSYETGELRKRKYYHLTLEGKQRMFRLINDYHEINNVISKFITETEESNNE